MSDKPKSFRHLFTLGFFVTVLLVIGGFLTFCVYYFIILFIGMSSISAEPEVAADSLQITHDSLLKPFFDSIEEKPKKIFISGDEYHPDEIHDSLFSFEINYDSTKNNVGEWNHFIKSVSIIRLSDHKKIQTVISPEQYVFESSQIPITVEDMNFDGYNDFRVLDFVMMYGQSFYHFWLYNPPKGLFEPDTTLSETSCAQFDQQTKTIYSSCRGAGPFDITNQTYTWENKRLVLQEEEKLFTILDSVPYAITMTKRINGKLVTRSKNFADVPITNSGQVLFDWDKLK